MQSSMGGRPMQSSMGGRPPPSSRMRGNLTSSAGTTAAQGVALSTEVNVSDRPVTQGGLRGIKTGQGPSRQVQDASFYIGLLRQKVTEITAEIGVLKTEVRRIEPTAPRRSFSGMKLRPRSPSPPVPR